MLFTQNYKKDLDLLRSKWDRFNCASRTAVDLEINLRAALDTLAWAHKKDDVSLLAEVEKLETALASVDAELRQERELLEKEFNALLKKVWGITVGKEYRFTSKSSVSNTFVISHCYPSPQYGELSMMVYGKDTKGVKQFVKLTHGEVSVSETDKSNVIDFVIKKGLSFLTP